MSIFSKKTGQSMYVDYSTRLNGVPVTNTCYVQLYMSRRELLMYPLMYMHKCTAQVLILMTRHTYISINVAYIWPAFH